MLTVLFLQNINFAEDHTHTQTPANKDRKQLFVLRPVRDTGITYSCTCTYMTQKIYKLWFLFACSKSSKRTQSLSKPLSLPHTSPPRTPQSTTCQRFYESGTWQWVSLTDSKLIQTALTPWRMALLCVPWYYSLCYKGRTSAFIIPFTILCLWMTHHSHKERLQCTGQGHAQKSCRPEEWLLLYLTYCSSA